MVKFPSAQHGLNVVWGVEGSARQIDYNVKCPKLVEYLKDTGVELTRIGIVWRDIEINRGIYDWDEADKLINFLSINKINPLVVHACAPDWALPVNKDDEKVFTDKGFANLYTVIWPEEKYIPDFINFTRKMLDRYRGIIRYIEFWNEPDGMAGPRIYRDRTGKIVDIRFGADPIRYTVWLKELYRTVKEVSPDTKLAAGSLSVPGTNFIRAVYASGGKGNFDAVSIHPYDDKNVDINWVKQVRAVMLKYGDYQSEVWVTEYGWNLNETNEVNSGGDETALTSTESSGKEEMSFLRKPARPKGRSGEQESNNKVTIDSVSLHGMTVGLSNEEQKLNDTRINSALTTFSQYPYITQIHQHTLNDWPWADENPETVATMGLVDNRLNKKACYETYKTVLTQLKRNDYLTRNLDVPSVVFTGIPFYLTLDSSPQNGERLLFQDITLSVPTGWICNLVKEGKFEIIPPVQKCTVGEKFPIIIKTEIKNPTPTSFPPHLPDATVGTGFPLPEFIPTHVGKGRGQGEGDNVQKRSGGDKEGVISYTKYVEFVSPVQLVLPPGYKLNFYPGQENKLYILVSNLTSVVVQGKLNISVPENWQEKEKVKEVILQEVLLQEIILQPEEVRTVEFTIYPRDEIIAPRYEFKVNFTIDEVSVNELLFTVVINCLCNRKPSELKVAEFLNKNKISLNPFITASLRPFIKGENRVDLPTPEFIPYSTGRRGDLGRPDGFSGENICFGFCWDDQNLYFYAEIEKDKLIQTQTGAEMWREDSVQIAFDTLSDAVSGSGYDDTNDYEYLFGLTPTGPVVWRTLAPSDSYIGRVENINLAVEQKSGKISYQITIPWTELTPFNPQTRMVLPVAVLFNLYDGTKRKPIEWAAGIEGRFKSPDTFINLCFDLVNTSA